MATLRCLQVKFLLLTEVIARRIQQPLGRSQYAQEISGIFHSLLFANLIVSGAVQLSRARCQRRFGVCNALWYFGIVVFQKRGLVNLFPVSAHR